MKRILKWLVCYMGGHELNNREEKNVQPYTHHIWHDIKPVECVYYESRYTCKCGRHKTDWQQVHQPKTAYN